MNNNLQYSKLNSIVSFTFFFLPRNNHQVQEVIGFCCDFLFCWLDDDNILEVEKLADIYGLDQLGGKIRSYLLKNIQTFSRTPVYRKLPAEKVLSILSSNELEVNSENEVFEAALHYHYTPEEVEKDQVVLQVRDAY